MAHENTIEFVPGLIVKQPADNAPDYVICKLSIKPRELAAWLSEKSEDWVNVELKLARSGKPYAAVDSWRPQGQPAAKPARQAPAKQAEAPTGCVDFGDDAPW